MEQVALTSHEVAVRPKITTHTHTSAHKQVPPLGGFLVPNILACWDSAWCVFESRKEKKQGASSSHCASFKQDSVYCFSLCCISNNSGFDESQWERVCVSPDSGAQQRNTWPFFIYSAACCSFFPGGYGGQSRASVEDSDFSPGVFPRRKYTCHLFFCVKSIWVSCFFFLTRTLFLSFTSPDWLRTFSWSF